MTDEIERRCPDDGRCWHECAPTECFRVRACLPLTNAFGTGEWPESIIEQFGGLPSKPCLEDLLVRGDGS